MLTQEQSREYTRFKKLQEFLTGNAAIYANFPAFAEEVDEFTTNMDNLNKLVQGKTNTGKGITTGKTALKQQVADALGLVCKKTYAYALKYNNPQLAAEVNNTSYKIFKMKDSGLQAYATSVINDVSLLLADADYAKYGVTQLQLDEISANAEMFHSLIGKADVEDSGNTVASAAINTAIDTLRGNLKQFDLLVDEFAASDPGFVQGYHINSEVDNTGVRHSGIEGYVRAGKNGDAVTGATVSLTGTTKTASTDLKGYYHIDRTAPGDYMVQCSAAGYTTQTKLYHISKGRTEEVDWELELIL